MLRENRVLPPQAGASVTSHRQMTEEHSVQRSLIKDGAVIWGTALSVLSEWGRQSGPLKGQTICAGNVMLWEGKHGRLDEGRAETKAQVNDVPGLIVQLLCQECKQYSSCSILSYWNMQKINSHLPQSINHWLEVFCFSCFAFFFFFTAV